MARFGLRTTYGSVELFPTFRGALRMAAVTTRAYAQRLDVIDLDAGDRVLATCSRAVRERRGPVRPLQRWINETRMPAYGACQLTPAGRALWAQRKRG